MVQSLDLTAKKSTFVTLPNSPTPMKAKVKVTRQLESKNSSIDSLTVHLKEREKVRIGHGHLSYLMTRALPQVFSPTNRSTNLSGIQSPWQQHSGMIENY